MISCCTASSRYAKMQWVQSCLILERYRIVQDQWQILQNSAYSFWISCRDSATEAPAVLGPYTFGSLKCHWNMQILQPNCRFVAEMVSFWQKLCQKFVIEGRQKVVQLPENWLGQLQQYHHFHTTASSNYQEQPFSLVISRPTFCVRKFVWV